MHSYQEKLNHLHTLMRLAHIEDNYSEAEQIFIRKVAESLQVNMQDLVAYNPANNQFNYPNQEYKIIPLFHRLLILMGIDNKISNEEAHFCFEIGVKMGLHPQAVNELIGLVKKHGSSHILQPKLITEIFNKFSN